MSPERTEVHVGGRTLSLSNLDKVLYPATGFTKGDLIAYYHEVASAMLPHLAGRPLTLKRFPDGVDKDSFYEKHLPSHAPEWLERVTLPRRVKDKRGPTITYPIVNELAALIWAANLATIEFHVPMWRFEGEGLDPRADLLVFDLDPGPGTDILTCCEVALLLKQRLASEHLVAMPKTSGKKGMQLYVPLDNTVPWEEAIERAHELARDVEREHSDLVVTNMRRELRSAHVLIDWSQNNAAKTTVAPYSLRGEDEPFASTPISWDEIADALASRDGTTLRFRAADVVARVHADGDLMARKPTKARSARRGP